MIYKDKLNDRQYSHVMKSLVTCLMPLLSCLHWDHFAVTVSR